MDKGNRQPEERAEHDQQRQSDEGDRQEMAGRVRERVANARGFWKSKNERHHGERRDKTGHEAGRRRAYIWL